MNASELAKVMLEYEEVQGQADALKEQIAAAVMDIQSTQKVGNVTATYRKPRKSYLYQKSAEEHAQENTILRHTTVKTVTSVDWRNICKDSGIDAEYTEGEPSVSVKIK